MKKKIFTGLVLLLCISAASVPAREDKYPPRAIFIAAYRGDVELVKAILETGPDPDVRDFRGLTALHDAMFQKNTEVVRLLIEYGFDVNALGLIDGYTPLHYAVTANNVDAAWLLLANGADGNIKGKDGLTPLAKAYQERQREEDNVRREKKQQLIRLLSKKK